MRTLEYILTTGLVLLVAYLVVSPIVSKTAQIMDDHANFIAEAGR